MSTKEQIQVFLEEIGVSLESSEIEYLAEVVAEDPLDCFSKDVSWYYFQRRTTLFDSHLGTGPGSYKAINQSGCWLLGHGQFGRHGCIDSGWPPTYSSYAVTSVSQDVGLSSPPAPLIRFSRFDPTKKQVVLIITEYSEVENNLLQHHKTSAEILVYDPS